MLDALIAGGGPAGATTALLLARARRNVAVVERSAFPRTKACGEYLSAGCVQLLQELGVAAALAPHARIVRGVRLHGHGVRAQIDFPRPGWSLPRAVLDEALLSAAAREGAQIVHARLEACDDGEQYARAGVRLPGGALEQRDAGVVVGADGMFSIVARKCGLAPPSPAGGRFALGGHYRGFAGLDEYIGMFVEGDTYVAVNPLSDDRANVMLVLHERELASHSTDLETFAEMRARALARELLAGTQLEGKRIAIGPLAYRARRLTGRRVLLAGDAACFLNPFTGQGVYLAVQCARIAAQCILSGDIAAYERRARSEIALRERAARRVAALIGSPVLARAAAALLPHASWVVRPLVERITGAA